MAFDFDRVIDRRGGDSLKWNKYAGRDILPLWVADMDFAAPPAVLDALHRRVAHGCLGYGEPWPALVEAAIGYFARRYGWAVDPGWLVWLPGLVPGINVACRAVKGDVISAIPIYPPFLSAPHYAGKAPVKVPLALIDGRWRWDFAALEAAITPRTRLLLLCHPHNPVGRAWEDEELTALAALCRRHDLIVCSDEIHCDLVLDPDRAHRPFARFDGMADRTITLMSPSKTFNIPGLGCSLAIIADARLRRAFTDVMRGIVPHPNVLGLVAAGAAWDDDDAWREALLGVLRSNRDRVQATVARLPALAMAPVEATYLAWIDARNIGVPSPARFFEDAGVGLSDGAEFGLPGWVRLNFGCPCATLEEALGRMTSAILKRC